MKLSHAYRVTATIPVLAFGFSSIGFAACSSVIGSGYAIVKCTSTSDQVIISQSLGFLYHRGVSPAVDLFDWDANTPGTQYLAAGGTVEVVSLGGGSLAIGEPGKPAAKVEGIVVVDDSGGPTAQIRIDSSGSDTSSTYVVDGPYTYVNALKFNSYDVGFTEYVLTGDQADVVKVNALVDGNKLEISSSNGNGGHDVVNIGSTGTVEDIHGPVNIENQVGFSINIDDSADLQARTAHVTESGVTFEGEDDITWDKEHVDQITLTMGRSDDTVYIASTFAPLVVSGTNGKDKVIIGDEGSAQHILGPVGINNYSSHSALTIDDSVSASARKVIFSEDDAAGVAPADIYWTQNDVSAISLYLGDGDDVVDVVGSPGNSTIGGVQNVISMGNGNNVGTIDGSHLGASSWNVIFGGSGDDLFIVSAVNDVGTIAFYGGPENSGDQLFYTGGPASGGNPGSGTLTPDDPTAHPIEYTSIEIFGEDLIFRDGLETGF